MFIYIEKMSITKDHTNITGDPFADVGGYVIKYFQEKHPEWSIIGFHF